MLNCLFIATSLRGVFPTLSPAPSSYIPYNIAGRWTPSVCASCFEALYRFSCPVKHLKTMLSLFTGLYLTNEVHFLPLAKGTHRYEFCEWIRWVLFPRYPLYLQPLFH